MPEVLVQLNAAAPSLLTLPVSLEPPGFTSVVVDPSVAISMLEALHSLIERATDAVAEGASRAAAEILSRVDRHITQLINSSQFGRLRVFRVRSWTAERMISTTFEDLNSAARESRLFLLTPGETLPRVLQQALVSSELLSIDRETVASIGLNCSPTSAQSCLAAVSRASKLAGPGPRARLLSQIRTADPTPWRSAFRFLCHGEAAAKVNMAPLLRPNTSELGELLRSLLDRRGDGWRVLPEAISDALTGELARALSVENWGDAEIAEQLGGASDEDLALTKDMSIEAKQRLLLDVQDRATWRRLPIHSFVDETSGALSQNAFLQSDYPLPAILTGKVQLVRRSPDRNIAAQQLKFVEAWGPTALITIALEQSNPHEYATAILDALDVVDQLLPPLIEDLRRTPWLALASGPAKPDDVLDLPEDVALAASQLLTNQAERCFVTTTMLPPDIIARPAWNHIKGLVQTSTAALNGLALMIEGDPTIAVVADWQLEVTPIGILIELAKSGVELPLRSWPLFAAAASRFSAAEIEAQLLPALRGPLSADSLRAVLLRITEYDKSVADGARHAARKLFTFCLQLAGGGHFGPTQHGRGDITNAFLRVQPAQLPGAVDRYGGHVDVDRRFGCGRQSLFDDDVMYGLVVGQY
jgi:hypothetical protein